MASPPPYAPLKLTDDIKKLVDNALTDGAPILVAGVDEDGRPILSFRGSIHTYSDDQLGFWIRNAQGNTIRSLEKNPHVAFVYRNGATRAMFQFHGKARIATDPAERNQVFENAPEPERNADKDRNGLAIIVDLDRVEGLFGFGPNGPIGFTRMARAAG